MRFRDLHGHVKVIVFDGNGMIKSMSKGSNTLVVEGRAILGDLLLGLANNTISSMNIGSSDQSPSENDVDLIQPATPIERIPISNGGRLRTNLTLSFSVLVPSNKYDRPLTIREVGVYFDPITDGKMFARAVIDPIVLNVNDSARVDYEIQL
ncbi:MAG: hypothetical protein KatS3mg003_0991 [Candidatus Nitrosocaldaceae archaeon]|nr:MAG: hypothetical protein KatS3mg003_0991 [Candidatus Nitrosocaldaceae archaeon]